MRLRIGIDLDDVVTESVKEMAQFHAKVRGMSVPNIQEWEDLRQMEGIDGDPERMHHFLAYFTDQGGFRNVPAVPGAVEHIRDLLEGGDELYFISARNSRGISDTYRWFEERGLPIDKMFFDRDKAWQYETHKLDVMVDDGMHNLEAIRERVPQAETIVYHRPWNLILSRFAHRRARSWGEVWGHIEHVRQELAYEQSQQLRLGL